MKTAVRWLALAGLVGLAGATLATLLAGFLWLFDLASHFRLQYVVAAIVLALLLAWTRPRWAALAALLLGAWHGYVYLDVPAARTVAQCQSEMVEILDFNLLYRNQRKDEVVAYIAESGADIVVLEENVSAWAPHLETLAEHYPYRVPENWRDADGPTLLSQLPIRKVESVRPFEQDNSFADPALRNFASAKWYLVADVVVGDLEATIIAVHPPLPNGTHLTFLRDGYLRDAAVRAGRATGAVVVVGDFNATPWSAGFDPLFEIGALASAGATHPIYPATWPSFLAPMRIPIDHMLVNEFIGVVSYQRGPDLGSDHFPIEATLCLDGGGA